MGISITEFSVFVVLIWLAGFLWKNTIARIIDSYIGNFIAFICAYLILPSRMAVNLPEQISKTIHANREYSNNVIPHKECIIIIAKQFPCFKNYILEAKT